MFTLPSTCSSDGLGKPGEKYLESWVKDWSCEGTTDLLRGGVASTFSSAPLEFVQAEQVEVGEPWRCSIPSLRFIMAVTLNTTPSLVNHNASSNFYFFK